MEAGDAGRGTREEGGSWESVAEVMFEEKGRFPLLRGIPGKEERVADEQKAMVWTSPGTALVAARMCLSQVSWLHTKATVAGLSGKGHSFSSE